MTDNKNFSSHKINVGFKEKAGSEKISPDKGSFEQPSLSMEKEKSFEQAEIKAGRSIDETIAPVQPLAGGLAYTSQVAIKMRVRQERIESILAEGLEDIYAKLPPGKRLEFKTAGEETARKINFMLSGAKFKIARIVELIKKWLILIPGVNRYFLEQEAKIKTDTILKIKESGG